MDKKGISAWLKETRRWLVDRRSSPNTNNRSVVIVQAIATFQSPATMRPSLRLILIAVVACWVVVEQGVQSEGR